MVLILNRPYTHRHTHAHKRTLFSCQTSMTGVEMRKMSPRREKKGGERWNESGTRTWQFCTEFEFVIFGFAFYLYSIQVGRTLRFIVIKHGSPHTCTLFSQLHSMAQTIIWLCVIFILFFHFIATMWYNCWCNSSAFIWNYGHSKLSLNKKKKKRYSNIVLLSLFKFRNKQVA